MAGTQVDVRVAAVADIHVSESNAGSLRPVLLDINDRADILVLAGDLTNRGLPKEGRLLLDELSVCRIPVVAVIGNHDVESDQTEELVSLLCSGGLTLLDIEPIEIDTVGFAGTKGFCGGFDRHALAPWGESTIKEFVRETIDEALKLESGLGRLRTPHRIGVLHYSPVRATVEGEPPEIFAFLGSSRLAEPLDRFEVDACVHGHAHNGSFEGRTAKGIPVFNVAMSIMRSRDAEHPYHVIELTG
jgi:Icc-related predicted phosphoesterase